MEVEQFLHQLQSEVAERFNAPDNTHPYRELVFCDLVMKHMAEAGICGDPTVCHYAGKHGNANLRLSGYALSDEADELDLFVSLYEGNDEIRPIPDSETSAAAEQCLRFLKRCVAGGLAQSVDPSTEAYALVQTLEACYSSLEQIRINVLTDRQARTKTFKPQESGGRTIRLEVMDIERLHRHLSEGKPRDELVVNFEEVCGAALPCVFVPDEEGGYDYALTAIPGEALRFLYGKYGARLLEANVRSFLSSKGVVNKGIRDTLRDCPERFMAYNNGVVLVVDELRMATTGSGQAAIAGMKGMQIVNGGQTTASLYFARKKDTSIRLDRVRVPAKVVVLRTRDEAAEEALIGDISRFANSQNAVKQADLSANRPFHVEFERMASTTWCPDGQSRWFYERAAGSYSTLLAREGDTPARLKKLKETVPSANRITKTDLAKYLNAWVGRPDLVSRGSQKNFAEFMKSFEESDSDLPDVPDVPFFKRTIAKAILFRTASRLARRQFSAFQGNVATYLVALMGDRLGRRLDLDRIWQQQDVSPQLEQLMRAWADEVNARLQSSAGGRMISEWAKKPECWTAVQDGAYLLPAEPVPELRA